MCTPVPESTPLTRCPPNLGKLTATTHSPYLLNYLEPEQVRLTVLRDDGSTVCGKMTDHPKFAKWKDEFSPGEMWSTFGEKWVAEKGAAA